MSKETVKKKTKQQDRDDEFLNLVRDLKEIVIDHNQRLSEVEGLVKRVSERLGL